MPSIATVYTTVLPETSAIAAGVKSAFRSVDGDAREAGRRWGREIQEGIGDVKVDVDADTSKAKAEIDSIGDRKVTVKVDVDRSNLDRLFGGGGGGGGGGGLLGGVGGFGPSALKLNVGLVGIGLLPAAATAIADVAGAVQQLAGAGLVLPGVFAGIAGSVGTAALGMSGMKDALDAVNKAADGTQKSVDAANKALAGLAPNAAETVKTVAGLKGTFEGLRNVAGQNMFAGVSGGLKSALGADLPALTRGIDSISRGLNQNILQGLQSLSSGASQGLLDRILGNTGDAQARVTKAIDPIVHAFGTLTAAGSDTLPRLADAVGNVAERFDKFITAADGDGRLDKWIKEGLDGFTNLGNILLNLGKSFTAITQAAGGGAGLLGTLDAATGKMQTFLNSTAGQDAMKRFFADGRVLLGQLKDIAVELGPILSGVFSAARNAAGLWLPVIREALSIINRIPGGAQAVVTAFVAWRTISGVSSLVSALGGVSRALGVLPGQAAAAAGGISAALGPVAALAASIAAITHGRPQDYIGGGPNSPGTAAAQGDWWRTMFGDAAPWIKDKLGVDSGSGSTSGGNFGTPPGLGGGPGAQRDRRGAAPVAATAGVPLTSIPTVPLTDYVAPTVTESAKTGGSSAPNLPYTGTADPNAYTTSGSNIDAALLAGVPAGKYDSTTKNLALGLADCSSAVEDLVNIMDGKTTTGGSLTTMNAAQLLPAMGFVRGEGGLGDFRIGYNSGHMQATLPGGTPFNWGSDAAAAKRGIGGTGADDPAFTDHWYRPANGALSGMYPSAASMGLTSSDLSLRNAQQRVNDTQHSEEQAQARLDELNAKGTATARQREAAEYALAKAKREHKDAIDALSVAQDKYNKSSEKQGSGSDSGASQLGQDFLSGIGEIFGVGDLFKDPTSFGLFKIVKAFMGLKLKDGQNAQGGDGASLLPGGGGGGLGGLLSFLPQPFGDLQIGSPKDAPGQFIPSGPGGSGGGIAMPTLPNPFAPPNDPSRVAGPGNSAPTTVVDQRGSNFGYSKTAVEDSVLQGQLPAIRTYSGPR